MSFNQFPRRQRMSSWIGVTQRPLDSCLGALLTGHGTQLSSPGCPAQKDRESTVRGPPVPRLSCETRVVSSSERPLRMLRGGATLIMPLAQLSRCLCHSLVPHEATPTWMLCFRICFGGSRLRQAPTQYQTCSSLPALHVDGSAIACWQSAALPSGPCNKNRLEGGWVARVTVN